MDSHKKSKKRDSLLTKELKNNILNTFGKWTFFDSHYDENSVSITWWTYGPGIIKTYKGSLKKIHEWMKTSGIAADKIEYSKVQYQNAGGFRLIIFLKKDSQKGE